MIQLADGVTTSPVRLVLDADVEVVSLSADIATVAGVLFAFVAAWIAIGSLRSQARGQKLESISFTNAIWDAVSQLGSKPVQLSPRTVWIVQRIHSDLEPHTHPIASSSSLGTIQVSEPLSMEVPFIVGALLPRGNPDKASAPAKERHYLEQQQARAVSLGYVWSTICDETAAPPWAPSADLATAREELAIIDRAMEAWVERMNEIAELFELAVLDRRAFVGIRSVALVQRLFVAEPYILWRNTVKPGRWGLRLFGLGSAARCYHWASVLQRDALRLWVNPGGFGPSIGYPGFVESLGWIIGAGSTRTDPFTRLASAVRLRNGLGSPFGHRWKRRYNKMVAELPHNPSSGYTATDRTLSWHDVATDPNIAAENIRKLHADRTVNWSNRHRVAKTLRWPLLAQPKPTKSRV